AVRLCRAAILFFRQGLPYLPCSTPRGQAILLFGLSSTPLRRAFSLPRPGINRELPMGVGRFLFRMVGKLVARPIYRRIDAFPVATREPREVQLALLREIVQTQAGTGYGRDHGLAAVSDLSDFRRQVPINSYENLAPYIQRMMQGEVQALVADPAVLLFALTS